MLNAHKNTPIRVLGSYWHTDKKEVRFKIEIKTISGRKMTKVFGLSQIEEFSVFRRTMVEAGFSFSGLRTQAADMHAAVMCQCRRAAENREGEHRLTSELGWRGGVFVLPGTTVPANTRLVFEREHGRHYAHTRSAGTLKVWQEEVAAPAVCSSRMVTTMAAAFAAPLLLLAGRQVGGFGLSLAGASRTGKTTALRLAKSIIDEPTPDGWGMSRAGGIAALSGYTDLPVFSDETAAVRGSGRGNNTIVTEITDVLSGGKPDTLHPSWQSKQRHAGSGVIRSILFATTEGKLDPWRRQGERARLIEVPAERLGSFGMIDYPERAHPAINSKTKAGEQIERLDRVAAQNHGHALPRFVEQLVAHQTKVPVWIGRYTAEFCQRAAGRADRDGWARSVLTNFALIYAAGRLAHRFGIVPWSEGVVRDAVLRCWDDAIRVVATPETRAAEAAARVRRWIVGAKRVATVGVDFYPEKVNGYEVIHDRDRGEAVALVQRDRLVAAAGGEAALTAALDYVVENGWLLPNRDTGAVTRQKRFDGTTQKLRFVYFRRAFLGKAAMVRR
jgi:hypothetical protein